MTLNLWTVDPKIALWWGGLSLKRCQVEKDVKSQKLKPMDYGGGSQKRNKLT